jgi:hypothetical protein
MGQHRAWHPAGVPTATVCSVRGCFRCPEHRGLCSSHYRAQLKVSKPPCSIKDCGRRSWAAGVCRWHRFNGGVPIRPVRPPDPSGSGPGAGCGWKRDGAEPLRRSEASRLAAYGADGRTCWTKRRSEPDGHGLLSLAARHSPRTDCPRCAGVGGTLTFHERAFACSNAGP